MWSQPLRLCLNCGFRDVGDYCSQCSSELTISPDKTLALATKRLADIWLDPVPIRSASAILPPALMPLLSTLESHKDSLRPLRCPSCDAPLIPSNSSCLQCGYALVKKEDTTGINYQYRCLIRQETVVGRHVLWLVILIDERFLWGQLFSVLKESFLKVSQDRIYFKKAKIRTLTVSPVIFYKSGCSPEVVSFLKTRSLQHRTRKFKCSLTYVPVDVSTKQVHLSKWVDLWVDLYEPLQLTLDQVQGRRHLAKPNRRTVRGTLAEGLSVILEPVKDYLIGMRRLTRPDLLARLIMSNRLEPTDFIKYLLGAALVGSFVSKVLGVENSSFSFLDIPILEECSAILIFVLIAFAVALPAHYCLRWFGGSGKFSSAFIAAGYVMVTFYPLSLALDKFSSMVGTANTSTTGFQTVTMTYSATLFSRIYGLKYLKTYGLLLLSGVPYVLFYFLAFWAGDAATDRVNRKTIETLLKTENALVERFRRDVGPLAQKGDLTGDYSASIQQLTALIDEVTLLQQNAHALAAKDLKGEVRKISTGVNDYLRARISSWSCIRRMLRNELSTGGCEKEDRDLKEAIARLEKQLNGKASS